ncbi:MAG TPA: GNAT family N-acetyltransferase [Gaiellaceae bacterium]|nr:GNAT family N-acetyltransferase [Gaiellaceae bacterium]
MTFVCASTLSFAEHAELFTRAYEGYGVPMTIDEATLRVLVDRWDLDRERSLVAPGEGLVNLGVRDDRGWIGGLGVVPSSRRQGLGRRLMEAVLDLAPPTVTLEVLEQNEGAIRLYEELGFGRTRTLEIWSLKEAPLVEARSVEPAPLGQTGLPWQREDRSLPEDYERIEVDGGAMVFKGAGVQQLAADDVDAAVQLLSRGTALSYVNVPEGDVASEAMRRLGGELTLRQFEYVRYAN